MLSYLKSHNYRYYASFGSLILNFLNNSRCLFITLESFHGKVLFHTSYNEYFRENLKLFDVTDFIALLTMHIPPNGIHLIRRYGLYSSRSRGKSKMPARCLHPRRGVPKVPEGGYGSRSPT
ncbi:MAG: hypothetical protein FVQ80_18115 [Planctomycetes bacterium]|nr:hypothetical protein [Planctomycetota bacterium]